MTMIERVARAIAGSAWIESEHAEAQNAGFFAMARVAIEAMRDPTPEMVKVGMDYALSTSVHGGHRWPDYVAEKHRMMIDEALR